MAFRQARVLLLTEKAGRQEAFGGSRSSEGRGEIDFVAQTVGRVEGITVGGRFQLGAFPGGQWSRDLGGRAQDQRTVRDLRELGDERLGPDQALPADDRAIEDDRAHADEGFIAHDGRVHDGDSSRAEHFPRLAKSGARDRT